MKRFTQRPAQKLKTLQRGTLIVGGISILAIAVYVMVGVQTSRSIDSNAAGFELLSNDPINNGEIVCGFTWDGTNVTTSDVGPSAESAGRNTEIVNNGRDHTKGLGAGNTGRNISMFIGSDPVFNGDGIDFSIDFRRFEATGSFITRGSYFNFGMKNGRLCIKYNLRQENGKIKSIDEMTRYEIPMDTVFRNYRFIYNPESSKGEVFVDNIAVWSSSADDGDKMNWNNTDPLIIGDEMNGETTSKAVFDNMIIRSTNRGRTMPMQLLSFTAELRGDKVMINWFTGKEDGTDYFRVERSTDTYSYEEIGRVKASGKSAELKAYALLDMHPSTGVSYYRLSLPNTDVKSVWVPIIALRIKENTLPAPMPELSGSTNK
ncbi:MAG: hypothetical protein ABI772_00905 [Bacteroidota bacterium]